MPNKLHQAIVIASQSVHAIASEETDEQRIARYNALNVKARAALLARKEKR